jgi:PAS domain S-box-containing protein
MEKIIRVLIVEDMEDDALLIVREIRQGGFEPVFKRVDTGGDMTEALRTEAWDMIISDYSMPGFNGIEALRLSKKYDPDIPFILISGTIGEDIAVMAMKEGANDYLMKDKLKRLVPAIERELNDAEDRRTRKKAEEELQKSEREIRLLLDSTAEAIYGIDLNGNCTFANNACLKFLGYRTADEVLEKNMHELIHHSYLDGSSYPVQKCPISKAFQTGNHIHGEDEVLWRADGTSFPVEYWSYPKKEHDQIVGAVVTFLDISERSQAKASLRESEERYEALFERSLESVFLNDFEGNFIDANDAARELLGYTKDDIKSLNFGSLLTDDQLPLALETVEEILKTGSQKEAVEYKLRRNDGEHVYVESMGAIIYRDGKPFAIQVIARNITARKQAEKELRESEQKYRTILESIDESYFEVDIAGNFTFFNDSLSKSLGYSNDELLGMNNRDYMSPETSKKIYNLFKQIYRTGTPIKKVIYEIIRKDGSRGFHELHASLMKNQAGQPIGFRGIAHDITERKEAEKALKEANDIINESSSVAFTWKNQEGWPVEFVTENVENLFGYTAKEFITGEVNYAGCVHPEDLQRVAKEVAEYSSKEETAGFTHEPYRIIAKDGSEKIISDWTYTVRDNEGRITHYKGIVEDITERKRAEEENEKLQAQFRQAQKMEAIGTLAGGIAHDFNNILSSVLGYTELSLDDAEEGTRLRNNLQTVLSAGERATDLVQQILAFSRQSEREFSPIQVKLIIKEALKLLGSTLPTSIEIRQEIQSDSLAFGDPTQIHQVLLNLCTNADHAMREKGGLLEVTLVDVELDSLFTAKHPDMKPGTHLRLMVRDTGRGIPPHILDRIFDPFFTTKDKGEGTGMGLSVVHGIVKSHRGAITVQSEPGKGSIFNVFLPVIEKTVKREAPIERPIPMGTERILFIDDETPLANLGKKMLGFLGYAVTTRTSSIEALELFKARPDRFDLVITDMTMPNLTGDELALKLAKIRPDIPIILCTGFSHKITEEKSKEMGIKAYLLKPILREVMAETVRRVLDEKD